MATKSTKKNVDNLEKALNQSSVVDTVEQFELLIERVKKAQKIYSTFSQEKVDAIFKAAATAADKARIPLASSSRCYRPYCRLWISSASGICLCRRRWRLCRPSSQQ